MSSASLTPSDVPLTPRNRQHELADSLAQDWFADHPFKTAWFNAMSMTFPLGEKFFIDSVRHYSGEISDPKLQEDIRGFCGQEGFHRREHDRYNRSLCELRGYDHDYLQGRLEKSIARSYRFLSAMDRLAITAALEHITAIMAESSLADDSPMNAVSDPAMRSLWDWHAAEEMEHKSVAIDVFRAVGGAEKLRRRVMRQATFFLLMDVLVGTVHMLRRDGKLWSLRLWSEGWKFLFFRDGVVRRIWPAYREYFREGFHPWQRDTRALLNNWKEQQKLQPAAP
ncbi:MAG: putative metal-dependent hydrolase [Halieaceae bacterium]